MMRITGAVLILVLVPGTTMAKNRAILWGGNCNESSNATQDRMQAAMLKSMGNLYGELKAQKWEAEAHYDSEDYTQIERYAKVGTPSVQNAKKASRENLVASLRIAVRELKKNDQLLLSVFTHGSTEVVEGKTLGDAKNRPVHGWCVSTRGTLPELISVDDPEILGLLGQLKKKGVRLGFTDSSCFGGGSIPVLEKFGCVVSSQSALSPALAIYDGEDSLSLEPDQVALFQKNSEGSLAGIMDIMTDIFRKHREKPRSNRAIAVDSGKVTLESAYLATLLNFPDRRSRTKDGKPDETPIFENMLAQTSAIRTSFVRGEWWADFLMNDNWDWRKSSAINFVSLTERHSSYRYKGHYFSQPQYACLTQDLLRDPFPELSRFIEDDLSAISAQESEEELKRSLSAALTWDDRRHVPAEAISPSDLASRLKQLIEQYQTLRAEIDQYGRARKSAQDRAYAIKFDVQIKASDVLPPELLGRVKEKIDPEELEHVKKLASVSGNAQALVAWLEDANRVVTFRDNGTGNGDHPEMVVYYMKQLVEKSDPSLAEEILEEMLRVSDRYKPLKEAVRAPLISELKPLWKEDARTRDETAKRFKLLNAKKDEIQKFAVQAMYYDYMKNRGAIENMPSRKGIRKFFPFKAPKAQNEAKKNLDACRDFVLLEE